jgi:hypothetical protein
MSPALKVAESKQERSEERQALAQAVAQFAQRDKNVRAIEAAVITARSAISKARQAASVASELIEEAKAAQAQAMIDSALGVPSIAARTVKDARSALQAAEDDVAASISAESVLADRLKEAKAQLDFADVRLKRCVLAAVRAEPAVYACVMRFVESQTLTNSLAQIVEFFGAPGPHSYLIEGTNRLPDRSQTDASAPWRRWIEALRTDPDAPPPSV